MCLGSAELLIKKRAICRLLRTEGSVEHFVPAVGTPPLPQRGREGTQEEGGRGYGNEDPLPRSYGDGHPDHEERRLLGGVRGLPVV